MFDACQKSTGTLFTTPTAFGVILIVSPGEATR